MRAPLLSRTATARTATMMTTTGRRGSGGGRWERRPRRRCQRDVRGGGRGDARGGRLRRRRGDARGGLCEVSVGGGRAAGWKGEGDEEEADRPREEEEEVVGRQEEGAGGQKKNEKSDGKKKKKPSDDEKKPNRGKKCPYGKKKKKPEDPRTKRKSARRRGVQTRALTAPRSGRGPSCLRPVIAAGRGGGTCRCVGLRGQPGGEHGQGGQAFWIRGAAFDRPLHGPVGRRRRAGRDSLGSRSRGEEEETNDDGMLPGAIAGVLEDGQGLLERGDWDVGAKR